MNIDDLIVGFDRALRTLASASTSVRPYPAEQAESADLGEDEMAHAAGLMRVNHSGEICAQALYSGQAMTASNPVLKGELDQAAREETEHLAWTERRLEELGARTSLLNPLWYAGSFAMGAIAGLAGDRWNLGFLSETERQVEQHLGGHLDTLPQGDARSRAIVSQMRTDEGRHAQMAEDRGAARLPLPIRAVMRMTAKVMTTTAYRV
ncbi:MAG: 2-polyprenyl-3-methyl-6-methoxy-1,4-benzoquinone monooxygenase [Betaproteobacteria bacterium]|nr:2-polyprenyl-3-methyl-6-methoxy-1,4-benzoquinone monooxygenase [Betaproteobacteria bacterium]